MEEKLKILVVADDGATSTAISSALAKVKAQIQLSEVNDCRATMSILRHTTFDCILLDCSLPDQEALTLIQSLHSFNIKVPLVVLICQGEEQIAIELMKAGATDYISKSRVSAETLAHVLRNAMRLHRAEMQATLAHEQMQASQEQLLQKNQELERQRELMQIQSLKLMEISRLKFGFLSTMSHELRTPMNAIIGFSQILLRPKFGHLAHEQRDMLERILKNAKHLLMLLNDILDFSKLHERQLELNPELTDLTKLINGVVTEMRSLAEEKGLSLLVHIDLDSPLVVHDSVRIRQILINLLSNAIKFTQSGNIWVEVKDLPGDRVTISVKDTGIGIASHDFQHIFEAFRQVDQSITRKYPGTGLGLAIIYTLVQMMNGKIFLDSEEGVGSKFTIELPKKLLSNSSSSSPTLQIGGKKFAYSTQKMHQLHGEHSKNSLKYHHLKV